MKHRRNYLLVVFLFSTSAMAIAQMPIPLKGAQLDASVSFNSTTKIYTYSYTLRSSSQNKEPISNVDIDITSSPNSARLDSKGLVIDELVRLDGKLISETFDQALSKVNAQFNNKSVVPIGARGPIGWNTSLTAMGTISWGSWNEVNLLSPGKAASGLVMTSFGLPGIREATIEPYFDVDNLPDQYEGNVELTKQLKDSLKYRTKTVGPVAPPIQVSPFTYIEYITGLTKQSYDLGWIVQDASLNKLLKKLESAKKAIQNNRPSEAAQHLRSFVKEVEANALLKYNANFLIEKISAANGPRDGS